jgi:hypothetical protein
MCAVVDSDLYFKIEGVSKLGLGKGRVDMSVMLHFPTFIEDLLLLCLLFFLFIWLLILIQQALKVWSKFDSSVTWLLHGFLNWLSNVFNILHGILYPSFLCFIFLILIIPFSWKNKHTYVFSYIFLILFRLRFNAC